MELPLAFAFLELLLDLLLTDSGSIKKKVRHFMFLPLASTMSVFNCRAVGAHAEKSFKRGRQVQWRTEGDWGIDCSWQGSPHTGATLSGIYRKKFSVLSELLHSFVDGNSNWESKGTFPVRSLVS